MAGGRFLQFSGGWKLQAGKKLKIIGLMFPANYLVDI